MSDIKIWGRLTSANVQKVIWALEEIELPTLTRIAAAGSAGSTIRTISR